MAVKILVVEDDRSITGLLKDVLEEAGFEVVETRNYEDAVDRMRREMPDLVLLDIVLDGKDGYEVLRWVRRRSVVPVIIISARTTESEKVRGLRLGANDYVTKPFGIDELKERVRVALRQARHETGSTTRYRDGRLEVDLAGREVRIDGEVVRLSSTEFELLRVLIINAGIALSYDDLLVAVWGSKYKGDRPRIHDYVSNLRRKIEARAGEVYIENLPRLGYRFKVHPQPHR